MFGSGDLWWFISTHHHHQSLSAAMSFWRSIPNPRSLLSALLRMRQLLCFSSSFFSFFFFCGGGGGVPVSPWQSHSRAFIKMSCGTFSGKQSLSKTRTLGRFSADTLRTAQVDSVPVGGRSCTQIEVLANQVACTTVEWNVHLSRLPCSYSEDLISLRSYR